MIKNRRRQWMVFALLLSTASARGSDAVLDRHFSGVRGTFVLLDGKTGQYTRYDAKRAAERFAPCSTFKIPHAAIALESKVAPDSEYLLKYDPALRAARPEWAHDHTLRSAFQVSAVWYFQALARMIGPDREAKFVRQFHYGNEDTSGPVDQFWLGKPLRISADEQVQFLQKLHDGGLGLSDRTTRLVRDIMIVDKAPGWILGGKSGACRGEDQQVALWYVGFVEKNGGTDYFALEMGDKDYEPLISMRMAKARSILEDLGVLK